MVLGICGRGGSAREILELAGQINEKKPRWGRFYFIGDKIEEKYINNTEVVLLEESMEQYGPDEIEYAVSFGEPEIREQCFNKIKEKAYKIATLISPNVHIPLNSVIGEGAIITSNAFISVNVEIGNNVFIQPNTVIGHDCVIGNHTVVSALSAVAGNCSIGRKTYIALNCSIKEGTEIGQSVIVSMGSVVKNKVQDDVIVEGQPAKMISKNYFHQVFHL